MPSDIFGDDRNYNLITACGMLSMPRSTVEKYRDSGKMKGWFKIGERRWFIRGSDLKQFIDEQRAGQEKNGPTVSEQSKDQDGV